MRLERFTELVIAMAIAALVIAVAVNAVGVRAASKVQRGCDIPKAWSVRSHLSGKPVWESRVYGQGQ